MQSVERKLLFIPIIFILLRIWSLLFIIIDIEAPGNLPCPAVEFFLHMGVRVRGGRVGDVRVRGMRVGDVRVRGVDVGYGL